jgi:hypothetical protein
MQTWFLSAHGNGITLKTNLTVSKGGQMLWLVVGVVLLIIAIAGGTIVHPILFVLGILALVAFLVHWRGSSHV